MRLLLFLILMLVGNVAWAAEVQEEGGPDRVIKLRDKNGVCSLAVNGDGTRAYVHLGEELDKGTISDRLVEMDLVNGKELRVIAEGLLKRRVGLERMLVCPDGKSVLLFMDRGQELETGKPSKIRQIRLEDGKILFEIDAARQSGFGTRPAFSADGKILYCLVGEDRKQLRVAAIELATGKETASLPLPAESRRKDRHGVSMFVSGERVLEFDELYESGSVTVWEPKTGKHSEPVEIGVGYRGYCGIEPPPVTASADRMFFINRDKPDEIEVRELKDLSKKSTIKSNGVERIHVAGKLLLAGARGRVSVYNLEQKEWVGVLETWAFGDGYYKPVTWLNVSGDGRTLVVAEEDRDAEGGVIENRERLAVFDLGRYLKK